MLYKYIVAHVLCDVFSVIKESVFKSIASAITIGYCFFSGTTPGYHFRGLESYNDTFNLPRGLGKSKIPKFHVCLINIFILSHRTHSQDCGQSIAQCIWRDGE